MDAAVVAEGQPSSQPSPAVPSPVRASGWQRFWRGRASHWLLVVLVGIAGMVFNFWNLGGPSLWYDEVIAADMARQNDYLILHYMRGSFSPMPNMELYYLLLHEWVGLLSLIGIQPNEFMLRLPSAVFAVMGAVVLYQLGSRFFGGRFVGLLAALLYILNQGQIEAAQQTRSYGLLLLLCSLAAYVFLEALLHTSQPGVSRRTRFLWWGAFALMAALMPYVHLMSGLLILSYGILFVLLLLLPGPWRIAARRSFFWGMGSFALVALVLAPAIWQSRHGGDNTWVPAASVSTVINWLRSLSNGEGIYLALAGVTVAVGLLASGWRWVRAALGRMPFDQAGMLALACWFFIPAGVAYAVTQQSINLHLFYVRYLMIAAPAWWLAIAFSLHQLRRLSSLATMAAALVIILLALYSLDIDVLVLAIVLVLVAPLLMLYERYQRLALGFLFVLIALIGTPGYYADAAQQDYRSPYLWLQQRYQAGDGIFCHPNYACSVGMEYYFWAYPGAGHFDANSPGVYSWSSGGFALPATVSSAQIYAAEHDRIFFVSAPVINGTSDASKRAITEWLEQRYTLVGQYSSTVGAGYPRTVLVQLYVKKAAGP